MFSWMSDIYLWKHNVIFIYNTYTTYTTWAFRRVVQSRLTDGLQKGELCR